MGRSTSKVKSTSRVVSKGVMSVKTGYGVEYVPTPTDRQTVEQMVLLGATEEMIASCLGIDGICVTTLRKNFGDVLRKHRAVTLAKIAAGTIYQKALPNDKGEPGDTAAAMFVLKCRAGWRETDPAMNINAPQVMVVKRVIGVSDDDI